MIKIRPETKKDIEAIRRVNGEAFGRKVEGEMIDKLRCRGVMPISLVAEQNGEVIGHIQFNPCEVKSVASNFTIMTLGSMAVIPSLQKKGIGSQLVKAGFDECRRLGENVVVVLGHPSYYPRFGFVPARAKGIDCEFVEAPDDAWMVMEFKTGSIAGRTGTAYFPREYREAFDENPPVSV
ncbi:MAG TPA: N-acetyltransferase [Dehalococcoidales bacterium]|nr:N-acetyltransferase [Dehalococcoidales bacterium]